MKTTNLFISLSTYFLISIFPYYLYSETPPSILIKMPTFLGNWRRNFYGFSKTPEKLDIVWKKYIGGGRSGYGKERKKWYGTGWTGQPLVVADVENGKEYLVVGTFNHHLYKLDAETGEEIWKYKFDDIIKATPTIFDKIILCGSRRGAGKPLNAKNVESFRAISYWTGKKLWGLKIPRTKSISRDVDASALVHKGLIYIPAENGFLYILDLNGNIKNQIQLYTSNDVKKHKGNVVLESSPSLYKGNLYIASGSGHIYGIALDSQKVVWDFYCGADINSTPVITDDGYMFIGIEKQFIKGKGGVFKLDLSKSPDASVVWFFPTGNKKFGKWSGGVIGSVAISSSPIPVAAFMAIDGNVYIVSQDELCKKPVIGPDGKTEYKSPKLLWKKNIGGSISTPIFVDDSLIVAGYDCKLHIFSVAAGLLSRKGSSSDLSELTVTETATFSATGSFESTPVVSNSKIYIGCRNGWFYCLGDVK